MADWSAIKTEYITTQTSYRKLAEKYGVHKDTIGDRAKAENWKELRRQNTDKTQTKIVEKINSKKADKVARVDDIADKLLLKLEQAITELDRNIVVHKDKVETADGEKTTEYREAVKGGIVDRAGLKQLTAALKDLKEVKMIRSELDKQEQRARIANLQRQAPAGDDEDEGTGVIILPPVKEDTT